MRARLQRLRDAKFFTGWVNEFGEREVKLRLTGDETFEPGDYYLVEIYGTEVDAIFQARVTIAFNNQAFLAVHGPINYRNATENARLSVTGILGTVTCEGAAVSAKVIDISAKGVGLAVKEPVPQKALVKVQMMTPQGEIMADGEVRYCRPDPASEGNFRIGIRLGDMGRLERARWLRLFDPEAA